MTVSVGWILLSIWLLTGLACLWRWAVCLFFTKRSDMGKPWLVLSLTSGQCEAQLRAALEQCRFLGHGCAGVLAVDHGLTLEDHQICQRLSTEYPDIQICRPDGLERWILGDPLPLENKRKRTSRHNGRRDV